MINGYDTLKDAFLGYDDCYTIIGGTACDILMSDAGLSFRATKDVDMIMLIENRFEEFGAVFWKFIRAGGYQCGWKSSENLHFYRFTEPREPNYPTMIELFSRKPNYNIHNVNSILVPLHISDELSSLSAILLNEEYYQFMIKGRRLVDGISILSAEYLIPFKVRAWIDLTARKNEGHHVNSNDLKKHKNDVFRLFSLIGTEQKIDLSKEIKSDMDYFINAMSNEDIRLSNFGLDMKLSQVLDILKDIYLQKEVSKFKAE